MTWFQAHCSGRDQHSDEVQADQRPRCFPALSPGMGIDGDARALYWSHGTAPLCFYTDQYLPHSWGCAGGWPHDGPHVPRPHEFGDIRAVRHRNTEGSGSPHPPIGQTTPPFVGVLLPLCCTLRALLSLFLHTRGVLNQRLFVVAFFPLMTARKSSPLSWRLTINRRQSMVKFFSFIPRLKGVYP